MSETSLLLAAAEPPHDGVQPTSNQAPETFCRTVIGAYHPVTGDLAQELLVAMHPAATDLAELSECEVAKWALYLCALIKESPFLFYPTERLPFEAGDYWVKQKVAARYKPNPPAEVLTKPSPVECMHYDTDQACRHLKTVARDTPLAYAMEPKGVSLDLKNLSYLTIC